MSTESSAFEDRFVLFFDFLGTQEAVKNWPRERLHAFLELLISIAQLQSAESISMNLQDDGSARLDVAPEVTTFSDHVVVSYRRPGDVESPLTAPKKAIETFTSHWTKIVCEDAIRILSGVAEMGLQIGLLIRGGLSFGQLHHENGVVFGEAMIDAYTLECKVAKDPRIVVSKRVLAKITHCQPEDMDVLLQDVDGEWHLNYFAAMVQRAMLPPPNTVEQAMLWKRAHLEVIRENIDQLRARGSERPAAKWDWFKGQLVAAASSIPD